MKTALPNLSAIVADIKAKAVPATHRIVASAPIPLSEMMPKRDATPSHSAMLASTKAHNPAFVQPTKEDARLLNEANALRRIVELEAQAAIDRTTITKLQGERFELQGRLDTGIKHFSDLTAKFHTELDRTEALTRELAEARNDRKAEARTLANVFALHFLGAQGTGTADRIKAVGGAWKFHRANVASEFPSKGFWLMPDTGEANALCADLQAEGKSIRTTPV